MTWPFWIIAAMAWLSLWIWITVARVAETEGDEFVASFGSLLPIFAVSTCVTVFLAIPERRPAFHKITIWAHHASIFLLFLFLIAAEYFQAEAWRRIRRKCSTSCVAASFRRLWVLTETLPAAIALTIFLTGLRLIWDSPTENPPSDLWLSALILGFSFFFWDGILGYRPIVRRLWRNWKRAIEDGIPVSAAVSTPKYLTDTLQLLLHFISWPFIFLFGLFRWNPVTPWTQPISEVTGALRILPYGWPEVITAILLWLGTGLTLISIYGLFRVTAFGQHK